MSRDWDAVQGFEGWAAVLDELLQKAGRAAEGGSADDRRAAQDALDEFIDRSPNAVARRLDDVARDAMRDLFLATVEERVGAIAQRTAALRGYVKDVQAAAEGARQDAATIRLLRVRGAVDSMTKTVQSLQDLRETLRSGAAAAQAGDVLAVIAKIETLVAQVQEVRTEVEGLAGA
jgi:hypothetical protein